MDQKFLKLFLSCLFGMILSLVGNEEPSLKLVVDFLERAREKHLIQLPPGFFDLKSQLTEDELLPYLETSFKAIASKPQLSIYFEIQTLEELISKYPHLWKASQSRPWKTWTENVFSDHSRAVLPHDPILKDLAHLAHAGYIKSFSEEAFKGRVFRYREIIRLIDRLLQRLRDEDIHMIYEDSLVLERVLHALRGDLEEKQVTIVYPDSLDPGQPRSKGWKDWVVSGSSTMTHTTENGEGNDVFTHQFDLEIDHPWVTLSTTGTIDDQRLDDPTLDLHSDWRYKWEEGLVDFHTPFWKDYSLSIQGGNLSSLGFSEGLVASGVSVVGGRFQYVAPEEIISIDLADGMIEDERDKVRIGGVTYVPVQGWDLTAYAIDIKSDVDKRHDVDFAVASRRQHSLGSLVFEYGNLEKGGEGYYAIGDVLLFDDRLAIEGQWRQFRDFETELGNSPTYSGISGGDSESERGHGATIIVSPFDWINVSFQFDHSETYVREGRLDYYVHEVVLTPWDGFELRGEYEIEDAPTRTRISGGSISQAFSWGLTAGVEFSRDDDGTLNTETTQMDLSLKCEEIWPQLEGFTLSSSGTRTKDFEARDEDYQYGFSWEINDMNSLSARFTKSDTENDLWDFTWAARF